MKRNQDERTKNQDEGTKSKDCTIYKELSYFLTLVSWFYCKTVPINF